VQDEVNQEESKRTENDGITKDTKSRCRTVVLIKIEIDVSGSSWRVATLLHHNWWSTFLHFPIKLYRDNQNYAGAILSMMTKSLRLSCRILGATVFLA